MKFDESLKQNAPYMHPNFNRRYVKFYLTFKVSIDTFMGKYMNRPTHKELNSKILQAKNAASEGLISILEPIVIAADAIALGYLVAEIREVILEILDELNPNYYAGSYPPQKSYEEAIKGSEIFAFRWVSQRFGCDTYFKFALVQGRLWIISFHEHREN